MMEFKSIKEIIEFAKEKEEEAEYYYNEASKLATNPSMGEKFKELAKEERKHRQLLEEIDADNISSEIKREKVQTMDIADYLVEPPFSPQMSYQELLILAIKKEKKAFYLYTKLAEYSGNEKLKDLFQFLAQQEALHKLKLEIEYDEMFYQEF